MKRTLEQMVMNFLGVYPRIPKNTYWSYSNALSYIGKKSAMPPNGLATVLAMIPEPHESRLIDENVEKLKDKYIKEADAILLSSMVVQRESSKEVIRRANRLGTPVVAGGPYATQFYEEIGGVNHFVLGEAESGAFDAFLQDFFRGEAKKVYARVVLRKTKIGRDIDEKEYNRLVEFFKDDTSDIQLVESRPSMALSPIPRYDKLKMNKYGSIPIQGTRGCPNTCDFCTITHLFGHEMRVKEAERIVAELKTIFELKYRGALMFVDDNWTGNIKKVKAVLPEIIEFQKERNYPFSFFTEASLNLAREPELMEMMRDAGFNMVFVGIESPDKTVLESMKKFQNVKRDLAEDIKTIQSYGMEVTAGLIMGADKDPDDISDQIFNLCQEAGIVQAMVGLLTAARGSELYERLKHEGRLREDLNGSNTHNFELNFDPLPGKDERKIIENYKNLLQRLYPKDGKAYNERQKTLMQNLGPNPKSSRSIGWTELRAFGLSLLKQSFFRSYSKEYRKFLLHSLKEQGNLFPEAVTAAIKQEHYSKITHTAVKAHKFQEYIHGKYEEMCEYFAEQVQKGRDKREEWHSSFIKERDKFLKKARKKIERFPYDYQPTLFQNLQACCCWVEQFSLKEFS